MHLFRVWAPDTPSVDVVIDGVALPMSSAEGGWWERTVEDAGPGTRYLFSLDGGPHRPDPRSQFQPEGVDGPSEVVDQSSFGWTDSSWKGFHLPGSVLYELHIGTFTPEGTFDAAIAKLPHLVNLGVDAVELMPVAEFSGDRGWGYDGVDLYAPHHTYGGPEGLKRLVDACHAAGLGVIVDVVYNHLGPAGNYLPEFGPYFSDRHMTNWGPALNFDGPHSDEVMAFVIDNAALWLRDYHCDGLRLDAVHAIIDISARHILALLSTEVASLAAHLGKSLWLIAESDLNDPRYVRPPEAGGYGLDAAWADEWHHAVHSALTGEREGYYEDFGSLELLAKALSQAWVYDGLWSPHRRRAHGRPPLDLPGSRFVVSAQNHDQTGNRAMGERNSALMSEGRQKIAAALLMTSPFVQMLFMGEEWGASSPFQYFTDHRNPELGKAVSEGRRREFAAFGWDPSDVPDPQDVETFLRSKLDWSEARVAFHGEILEWHRQLIALRREVPALTDPRKENVQVSFDEEARWLQLRREEVLVAINLGQGVVIVDAGDRHLIMASDPEVDLRDGMLLLPPDSVAIARTIRGVAE